MSRWSSSAAVLITMVPFGPMAETKIEERFHERHQEGWFWYEPDPAPAPEEPSPDQPLPVPPPAPVVPEGDQEDVAAGEALLPAAPEPPEPMSAAWFRAHLDGFRDRALDEPSKDNIEAYLYLQRVALEKASRFAEASAAAAVRDPWLDANSERPIATYAAQAMDAQAEAAHSAVLASLAADAGILFFYQAGCPLCDAQAGVLKLANQVHGFEILPVSLGGSPPPDGLPPHREDDGQAETLGVASLPATFLVRPPDLIVPLAQAPLDLKTLGRRIIGVAHDAGLIDDQTYHATRAVRRPFTLPDDVGDLPPDVVENPAALVAHIRQKLGLAGAGDAP
ncbi:MAG: conjugal transfer protein TraF, partial [Alphaproteobacteria bacterium]|nr:conjugal transfer protein TraF [Alphaproteobacteria bacterium]